MNAVPRNLLGLSREELAEFAESIGEKRYRGAQLFGWLYQRGVSEFSAMSDLGKAFREHLALSASIAGATPVAMRQSTTDGTMKFLFSLGDGARIESVLIPPASAFVGGEAAGDDEQKRLTLCVSTQVGCPLDCKFCATGTMGYLRNLTSGEIIDQFLQVRRATGKKVTNVVFMGMGEPLMNYDNVMRAAEILSSGMGVARRRIVISSAGWAENIRRMGDEGRTARLALSLHSAVESTRSRLMPVTRKFSLAELRAALEHYYRKTRQRVTYEVIFFDGVNDTDGEVAALIKFARVVPCKINVIPFHSILFTGTTGIGATLRPSRKQRSIVERLRAENLTVMVRSSAGEDIEGACGQLAVREEQRRRPRRIITV
jgi:23S rRNA (adenine2503-C2)-methyltransferase